MSIRGDPSHVLISGQVGVGEECSRGREELVQRPWGTRRPVRLSRVGQVEGGGRVCGILPSLQLEAGSSGVGHTRL